MASKHDDSGYVDNWQTGKTVTECNLHMLTTEDCSDVIFRVGSEKHVVRAHRYVLVSRSCVFHAMFCGPLLEKGEVTIPDIEANIFREFLRYLYSDTADITAENVAGLLYTSRKYAVDSLLNQCVTFLEKSLCEENVCQILEQCHVYGEVDLEQKALKLLCKAGEKVIKSSGFVNLCSRCLNTFLKSSELNLKEEQIFKAALSWSKEKCREENISPTPENIRECLGDSRYEIRFTEFSQEYLVNEVGPSGILSRDERLDIMDRSVDSSVDITPFKTTPRKMLSDPAITRKEGSFYQVRRYTRCLNGWRCRGGQECIAFTTNKNIELVGCQLYGPAHSPESVYSLYIRLSEGLGEKNLLKTERKLQGMEKLNDIMFEKPVRVVAGSTYVIFVGMNGEDTSYGEGGLTSVTEAGVTFTFKKSRYLSQTSVSHGQIPGLLWKLEST